ncbi:hypothetical protein [Janibacter sp. GXQ6167]|uniref:hypothetical protein n=1 Tax=Janibacter sp. GXQ6167 TaxID=3240791 RepID=UPI003525C2E4
MHQSAGQQPIVSEEFLAKGGLGVGIAGQPKGEVRAEPSDDVLGARGAQQADGSIGAAGPLLG